MQGDGYQTRRLAFFPRFGHHLRGDDGRRQDNRARRSSRRCAGGWLHRRRRSQSGRFKRLGQRFEPLQRQQVIHRRGGRRRQGQFGGRPGKIRLGQVPVIGEIRFGGRSSKVSAAGGLTGSTVGRCSGWAVGRLTGSLVGRCSGFAGWTVGRLDGWAVRRFAGWEVFRFTG